MAKRPLKTPQLPAGDRLVFFQWMQRLVLEAGDKSTSAIATEVGFSAQAVHKALTGPRIPSKSLTVAIARNEGGESATETALRLWTTAVAEERAALAGTSSETEVVPSAPTLAPAVTQSKSPEGATETEGGVSADRVMARGGVSADRAMGDSPRSLSDSRGGIPQAKPTTSAGTAVLARPPLRQPTAAEAPATDVDNEVTATKLSDREREVLRAWLLTESKDSVAKQLHLAPTTVRTHLQRIRAKYMASGKPAPTKAAMVARAIEDGVITIDEL